MGRRTSLGGLRDQLADVAARLMIEQGLNDYAAAKRKAAAQLGASLRGALPSNREIEDCIVQRQRVFEPEHENRLYELRAAALKVMQMLDIFEPRLVGNVLAGTATANSVVELHAYCDSPEEVLGALPNGGRNTRTIERRVRWSPKDVESIPGFRFCSDDIDVLVLVFPRDAIRQSPLSSVTQRPMKRAARAEVERLQHAR